MAVVVPAGTTPASVGRLDGVGRRNRRERPVWIDNCARRFASRRFPSPRSVPMKQPVAALAAHGPYPSHHLIAAGANGYEPASAVPALDPVAAADAVQLLGSMVRYVRMKTAVGFAMEWR